ncbi:MAG: hypothetical protein GY861_05740 [bacterium]|nr:hypothetical protein [bacterium]
MDGKDHINIFSRGETKLGRMLSNFARSPLFLEDGHFESIEGYWYWISSQDDVLRKLYGFKAKEYGRNAIKKQRLPMEEFKQKIRKAINAKIMRDPELKSLLTNSTLPFKHYYVFGGEKKDAGFKWIVDHITNVRKILQSNSLNI